MRCLTVEFDAGRPEARFDFPAGTFFLCISPLAGEVHDLENQRFKVEVLYRR